MFIKIPVTQTCVDEKYINIMEVSSKVKSDPHIPEIRAHPQKYTGVANKMINSNQNDLFFDSEVIDEAKINVQTASNIIFAGIAITPVLLYNSKRLWGFGRIQRRWLRVSSVIAPSFIFFTWLSDSRFDKNSRLIAQQCAIRESGFQRYKTEGDIRGLFKDARSKTQ